MKIGPKAALHFLAGAQLMEGVIIGVAMIWFYPVFHRIHETPWRYLTVNEPIHAGFMESLDWFYLGLLPGFLLLSVATSALNLARPGRADSSAKADDVT